MTMLDELTTLELQHIDDAILAAEVARDATVAVSTDVLRRLLEEHRGKYEEGYADGYEDARDDAWYDEDDDLWDEDDE